MTNSKAIVYTTEGCGYTDMLVARLRADKVEYEEVNLSLHPDRWVEVLPLTGGERITPVMVEGEKVTIGFNGFGCVS